MATHITRPHLEFAGHHPPAGQIENVAARLTNGRYSDDQTGYAKNSPIDQTHTMDTPKCNKQTIYNETKTK